MIFFDSMRSCFCDFYEASLLFLKYGPVPLKEFKECCEKVSAARRHGCVTDEEFYELYGYYKQAKFGDFNLEDEQAYTQEEVMKRDFWKSLKGTSRKDAMVKYINMSREVLSEYKDPDQLDTNSGVFSRVVLTEDQRGFDHDDFFTLVSEGQFDKVKELLEKDSNLANVKSPEGLTALHIASDRGYVDLVECLLDHGASINAVDDIGDTSLHVALASQEEEVVRTLIDRGADVDLRNFEGYSPKEIMTLSKM